MDGCEPPCGCWDLNSGPLGEQAVSAYPLSYLTSPNFNFYLLNIINDPELLVDMTLINSLKILQGLGGGESFTGLSARVQTPQQPYNGL